MRSLRITARRSLPALLAVLAVAIVAGAGCGGKGKELKPDTVLAKVGDKEITVAYYEKKLGRLHPVDLPRDDAGNVMDTAQMPGKRKFLDTIINKDVMVTMATRLGFRDDAQVKYANDALVSYEAVFAARERFVNKPASEFTEDQVKAFYEKLGTVRHCRYFICNTREEALRGREKALAGAEWEDLWEQFHAGSKDGNLPYKIDIHYGRFVNSFEDPIFAIPVGDISEPVPSTYGWWIVKVDAEEQRDRPPLEEVRKTIESALVSRAQMRLVEKFKDDVHAKYKMYLNEETLAKAYAGLPDDETLFYPGTQDAVKREDLKPLDVEPRDFDLDFYGYTVDGEPRKYTLGDYKTAYDRMNVFERPKKADMMGGTRSKIVDEIDRALLNFDARDRGLDKDPEVLAKVEEKVEEMLVSKLFGDGVKADENIKPAALDSAWAELHSEYNLPEQRTGKRIVTADRAQAEKAYADLKAGQPWRRVADTYAAGGAEDQMRGAVGPVRADAAGPERDALFGLAVGELSAPFETGDGKWEVVVLDEIQAPRSRELSEVADEIVKRIRNKREEMAFRAALDGWKKQIKIEVFEDRLAKTRSWEELTNAAKQPGEEAGKDAGKGAGK